MELLTHSEEMKKDSWGMLMLQLVIYLKLNYQIKLFMQQREEDTRFSLLKQAIFTLLVIIKHINVDMQKIPLGL
jgi:hypothetical protein